MYIYIYTYATYDRYIVTLQTMTLRETSDDKLW